MKKIGYRMFAMMYYFFWLCPIKSNKVFCVMTHDPSEGGNVGVVVKALNACGDYEFITMKKTDREFHGKQGKVKSLLDFFFWKPYHLATSAYILQDNLFLPMAYLKLKKKVKNVQLWHGTGTIKKFGQSANTGELKKIEYRADQKITHLIINSEATHAIYKEAFAIQDDSKIYELGLPRTDYLLQPSKVEESRSKFYRNFKDLEGKRLILYAPTFRDDEVENPELAVDLDHLVAVLPDDCVLGLKLHPFVARNFEARNPKKSSITDRVIDFSMYDDLNQLLSAADCLITDYSSVIFEYCVLERPMIFYAYDYEKFKEQQRGFYEDYTMFVPGPIAYDQEGLERLLQEECYDLERVRRFKESQYRYTDGKATERLLKEVFGITI